jgi:PPIC-type PPIASE domain
MRRLGAVLMVLPLVACGALRDAFSAHAADAATAAGQSLTAEQLAGWASQVKGMPLQADNLSRLAGIWVNYTLFATTLANGKPLDDSALVLEAMWPLVSQAKWDHFRERLALNHTTMTPAQIDSVYDAGQIRAFQHILLQVTANASPDVVAGIQARLQGVLVQIRATHGANFATLARKYSEDATKNSGGYLGVWPRGHFVQPFEYPAWQLAPGEMTGVIRSPYGFHIIRRPPLAEIRDSFALGVQQGLETTFDSTYITRLRELRHLTVIGGAPAAARAGLQDADAAARSSKGLVRYDGGVFRVSDLVRWLQALDPQLASSVPGATDQQLTRVLETLATRDILLKQADSAKVGLTADDWALVKSTYDSSLANLESAIQLTPQTVRDSGGSAAGRATLALTHVNQYLDEIVTRRRGFLPVPPFLASALRTSGDWSVNAAGVQRAAEQAQAQRTAIGGGPSGPGTGGQPPLRPAPGPAPVPGAAPPTGTARPQPRGGR